MTSIGDYAFEHCSSLTSITVDPANTVYHSAGNCIIETASKTLIVGCKNSVIPTDGSVTSIGERAFYNCSSLQSITIPEGVTSIGDYAFRGCSSLTSITIGNSVTSIGKYAFYNCSSLTSITIGNSVTSIGSDAFSGCSSLTSITIGNNVTSIGDDAFYKCSSLYVVRNNSVLNIKPGSSNNGDVAYYAKIVFDANGNMTSVNDGSEYILTEDSFLFQEKSGKYYLLAYIGGESTITLPSSIEGSKYEISNMRGVVNVIIPEGVTSIGVGAFSGCSSLESITIPEGVTSIGGQAFYNCSSFESITIPEGVTSIGYQAFYNTAYYKNDANWENGVLYIGNHLIEVKTSMYGSYTIKSGTKCIADYAFSRCSSLTSITIPDSVTSIGGLAFWGCSSLTSITIPNSVTSIGNYAFEYCSSLTSITIPDSVTSIGNFVFYNCSSLTSITFKGTKSQWRAISKGSNWNGLTGSYTIHCTDGDLSK